MLPLPSLADRLQDSSLLNQERLSSEIMKLTTLTGAHSYIYISICSSVRRCIKGASVPTSYMAPYDVTTILRLRL